MEKYKDGFKPSIAEHELNKRFRKQYVFACDMGDLFGEWVPRDWILKVLKAVRNSPSSYFLFLTKNPKRYFEFLDVFPKNLVLGATIESNRKYKVSSAPLVTERYECMEILTVYGSYFDMYLDTEEYISRNEFVLRDSDHAVITGYLDTDGVLVIETIEKNVDYDMLLFEGDNLMDDLSGSVACVGNTTYPYGIGKLCAPADKTALEIILADVTDGVDTTYHTCGMNDSTIYSVGNFSVDFSGPSYSVKSVYIKFDDSEMYRLNNGYVQYSMDAIDWYYISFDAVQYSDDSFLWTAQDSDDVIKVKYLRYVGKYHDGMGIVDPQFRIVEFNVEEVPLSAGP